ncbi:MAG TPA: hypothetical protein VLA41_11440 [Burkholderiales bacterium]|nr:hypothetical protein [Burkholderiales bacterium]
MESFRAFSSLHLLALCTIALLTLAAAALYVAAVLPIDLAFGWNYGFVGPSKPGVRSIVDFLGPWPWRLAPIVAIAAAAMALAQLPWTLAARLRRRGSW